MKIYEVTVTDRVASPSSEEPVRYESYVAVDFENDGLITDWDRVFQDLYDEYGLTDENIHYYFTGDEWEDGLQDDRTIETDEFTYWVGEEVARLDS